MARTARIQSESGYYHLMIRGNNKSYVFKDQKAKSFFIRNLLKSEEEGLIDLAAWCVMDNHVHVVLKANKEDLALAFKQINVRFAIKYHHEHKTSGHIFQDRFKTEPIETEQYLVRVVRYVHNNPVKGKIVDNPSDYKWSSYNRYLCEDLSETKKLVYQLMGDSEATYKQFHQGLDENEFLEINEDLEKIREQKFRGLIELHMSNHNVTDSEEFLQNEAMLNKLIKDLIKQRVYSLRLIASKLRLPYSKVHKCSKAQEQEMID
jgi:REP element-mobilizing transposase RayT